VDAEKAEEKKKKVEEDANKMAENQKIASLKRKEEKQESEEDLDSLLKDIT